MGSVGWRVVKRVGIRNPANPPANPPANLAGVGGGWGQFSYGSSHRIPRGFFFLFLTDPTGNFFFLPYNLNRLFYEGDLGLGEAIIFCKKKKIPVGSVRKRKKNPRGIR